VDDLEAILDRLAADGYRLVGGIGQYENIWRMAYVRGPEGIIVCSRPAATSARHWDGSMPALGRAN
jgi:hypothetical protein